MPKQSRKNQDAAELFAKNAEAYYHLENYDSAIKEMDKAISLEPRNSEYYFNRALAYNDSIGDYLTSDAFEKQSKKVKNRFQRSIEDLTKTIYLDPQNTSAYLIRAHLYRFMEKDFQAIRDFIEVISLDPENEDASHWLTTMLNVQEQSEV